MSTTARLLPALLAAALLAGCATSQRVVFLEMPPAPAAAAADSAAAPVDVEAYRTRYPDAEAVYLLMERTTEHSGARQKGFLDTGRWTYSSVRHDKYIVFAPDETDLTTLHLGFRPDHLYVRVTAPDGTVRDYGLDDLREGRDEDGDRSYTVVYRDVVPGTVVEKGWDFAFNLGYPLRLEEDFDLRYRWPCERSIFTYAYPDWWRIAFKDPGLGTELPVSVEDRPEQGKKILTCEAVAIPALKVEPYAPFHREVADYLQFHVTELEMLDMRYKASADWSEFGRRFQGAVLEKAGKNRRKLTEIAEYVTADAPDDQAKVAAVVAWVRDEVKLGEPRDGDFAKVLKEKSGGAVDISGLTCTLLDCLGLPARVLLLHSAVDGNFDPDYIESSQFSFPAVGVELDDSLQVVLPYMDNVPVGFVPEAVQGQPALAIASSELFSSWDMGDHVEYGASSLVTLPGGDPRDNTSRHEYDLEIRPDGEVQTVETVTVNGGFAYRIRQDIEDLTDQERQDYVKEMVTFADGEIRLDSYEIAHEDDLDQPLVVTARYAITNLVTVTPEEVIFHTGGLFSPLTGIKLTIDPAERQNPILVRNDEQHDKRITIRFPAGWTLATELPPVLVDNDFGTMTAGTTAEPGAVHIDLGLHLNAGDAPAARYGEFLAVVSTAKGYEVPALVFGTGAD